MSSVGINATDDYKRHILSMRVCFSLLICNLDFETNTMEEEYRREVGANAIGAVNIPISISYAIRVFNDTTVCPSSRTFVET